MTFVFVSNYINHHQIPFCTEMRERLGEDFVFIQTEPMEEERLKMGWKQENDLPYVKYAYQEPEECNRLVMESDIVLWGGAEDETMLKPRLDAGKPVIRYSERLYKTGQWKAISPRGLRKKYHDHTQYRKAPIYLLCAGAYVASDFNIIRAYPDKMFQWGYFPELKEYNEQELEQLFAQKPFINGKKAEIVWAARFIKWKHPNMVVDAVRGLLKYRDDFHVTMIGTGELEEPIRQKIKAYGIENYVTLAGKKTPSEVRQAMEKADLFWMTSDRQEGWGAVMNEAMNSGCVVIANWLEGATPFLIDNQRNGMYYKYLHPEMLVELTDFILKSSSSMQALGRKAYETIAKEWNAKVAAGRLLLMCEDIIAGRAPQHVWKSGPCSKAAIIKETN